MQSSITFERCAKCNVVIQVTLFIASKLQLAEIHTIYHKLFFFFCLLIIAVIIDALNADTIKDALLVPVSVNYERLCDGNFVYEQLGEKKKPEKFTSAVKAIWEILNSRYGQMRIDFNEPFSLRELIKAFEKTSDVSETMTKKQVNGMQIKRLKHQPSTSSLYGTDVVNEEHRALVDSIARHVVYDCASATACMTTNAVAFLLLTRFVEKSRFF